MTVLEICKYTPPYPGNFIKSLLSIERADHDVRLMFAFPVGAEKLDWVKDLEREHQVFILPMGRWEENMAINRICKSEKVDIAHSHFYGMISSFIAAWTSKTKFIQHLHNTQPTAGLIRRVANRLMSLGYQKIIGCSEEVMHTAKAAGFAAGRCTYVVNRIDFERLDAVANLSPFTGDGPQLMILGSDYYRKGCDLAIRACAPLVNKYHLTLNIISVDPKKAKSEALKDLNGNIPSWIHFPMASEHVGDYYRASTIFLSPSRAEGLSYAVLEAMYCGALTIKSDINSMIYGLKEENLVTVPLEVKALRQRIEEFLEMEAPEREAITKDFHQQVKEKYGLEEWGKEVDEIYRSV
ncbi:MAG: glycosyltransferase family 4 protein [Prevotella sp.]|nr:glycosyltransferase family 4 protein [Prevotella sp.]